LFWASLIPRREESHLAVSGVLSEIRREVTRKMQEALKTADCTDGMDRFMPGEVVFFNNWDDTLDSTVWFEYANLTSSHQFESMHDTWHNQ